jgi:hypothetical protein
MNTRNQDALHALQHVLGKDKKAIFMSLVLIFTLGLANNALYEILKGWPLLMDSPSLIIIPFLGLFWHAYRQYNDAVQQWKEVRPKILVMFLSLSNRHLLTSAEDKQFLQHLIDGTQVADMKTALEKLDPIPWVMPLVAIDKHQDLKQVIIIPSADPKDPKSKNKGTYRELNDFKALLKALRPRLKITGVHEILKEYSNGVDFEDLEQLSRVLKGIYQTLNLPDPKELLIDITGGQKTNTVAGIIFRQAEGEDCQYQYVSTHNKEVIPF